MHIRPLTKRHIPAAAVVVGKAIDQVVVRRAIQEWRTGFDLAARKHVRLQRHWVAEAQGTCMGVAGLLSYRTTPKHVAYLSWFAVDPRWQRHGVGSHLLTRAERYATS